MGNRQFADLNTEEFDILIKSISNNVYNLFKAHGVLCLTNDKSNIPMWAHYAKNHTGYCVIFELNFDYIYEKYKTKFNSHSAFETYIRQIINPSTHEDDQEILSFTQQRDSEKHFAFFKILYKNNKPLIPHPSVLKDLDTYTQTKQLIKYSIGVKFYQWQYENEYRLVSNANSKTSKLMRLNNYCPFLKITGIIMGKNIGTNLHKDLQDFLYANELNGFKLPENMEEKLKAFISLLCSHHNIELFLAKPSKENYRIIIEKISIDPTIKNIKTGIRESSLTA